MSHREVMQQAPQALEAMTTARCGGDDGTDISPINDAYDKAGAAITTIRAALAEPVQEPVACLIGTKGSAFDSPTTKRAYTYAEQPGNVVASRLGLACNAAASQSAGDSIDRGLGLLQELQRQGFGVFDLGAEYAAPPQRKPWVGLTEDERTDICDGYGANIHWRAFRAIEAKLQEKNT